MEISRERVAQLVKEELTLEYEGQQSIIALAHLSLTEDQLDESITGIFDFFKQAMGLGLDSVTDTIKQKAISYVLSLAGLPEGSYLNKILSNILEQFSVKEWQTIMSDDKGCEFFAKKVTGGLIEALAEMILEAVTDALISKLDQVADQAGGLLGSAPNAKAQTASMVAKIFKSLPSPMKVGTVTAAGGVAAPLAAAAASRPGQEFIANLLRTSKFGKQIEKKLSGTICQAVQNFKKGKFNLPDLSKMVPSVSEPTE